MKAETLYKYLNFISDECDRHLRDGEISYDEINQLSLELEKLKKLVNRGNILDEIKIAINSLSFKNDNHKTRKNWFLIFLSNYTSNNDHSTDLSYYRAQSYRIEDIEKLKGDVSNLKLKLKMIK